MSGTCDDIVQDEGGPRVERPFDPSTRKLFCAACPKYVRRTETCPILGIRRVPSARMCRYGERLWKEKTK